MFQERPPQEWDERLGTGRGQGVGSGRTPGCQEYCLPHREGMLTHAALGPNSFNTLSLTVRPGVG